MAATLANPVTNNAVAGLTAASGTTIFSLMGMGPAKIYAAISSDCYALAPGAANWLPLPALPDRGRIAATSQVVGNRLYLFGGFNADEAGAEHTSASVNIFDLRSNTWTRGVDIPTPVDDSVSVAIKERYIYLIGGWSESRNVNAVQLYDTWNDSWRYCTPIMGKPVFGHFGAGAGDKLFYFDGVSDQSAIYKACDECWIGTIDAFDFTRLAWSQIPAHPGRARYRSAATVTQAADHIVVTGGTDNPYNINGIGYDGNPSKPVDEVIAWDLRQQRWIVLGLSAARMDLRGAVSFGDTIITVGGMDAQQAVQPSIVVLQILP